ncbi:MAG: DUF4432 family protein [Roseiflexaceae bacterium]|nr:DUF4432 family protein [Roseiflexaceae bacterium]
MPHTSVHTHGCRVSDEWTLRGMRAAVLENDLLRVMVLLDRGAEIVEFRYKPRDLDLLARWGELRNPAHERPSVASPSGTFLDYYVGGWQEILPNGGAPATHRGVEYGQHGEVCLVPWACEVLEDSPERVSLRCTVRALRTPLRLERIMTLEHGRAVLTFDERLINEAAEPLDVMWGHHIAFGLPFLTEGATIATSARQVVVERDMDGFTPRRAQVDQRRLWPNVVGANGGPLDLSVVPPRETASGREMAYLSEFDGAAWYAITNPATTIGVAVRWDSAVFRYLWLWQELGSGRGYPWWGRAYTVALEPWTSMPTAGLAEATARGTQLVLQPGQIVSTRLTATAFHAMPTISSVDADGTLHGK